MGKLGPKTRSNAQIWENLVNTLVVTFLTQFLSNLVRMLV
jgi:hypothetical protein